MTEVVIQLLSNYKKEEHKEVLRDRRNPSYDTLLNEGNMIASQYQKQEFHFEDYVFWAIYIPQKSGWVVIKHTEYDELTHGPTN